MHTLKRRKTLLKIESAIDSEKNEEIPITVVREMRNMEKKRNSIIQAFSDSSYCVS